MPSSAPPRIIRRPGSPASFQAVWSAAPAASPAARLRAAQLRRLTKPARLVKP